jgi:hypothetical protein
MQLNSKGVASFSYRQFSKGIYFDGHERDDVVEHTLVICTLFSWHTNNIVVCHATKLVCHAGVV